ncbi:MAG: ABC transporter permease [Acetobacteraceae bacterium]|nr:ABC transporter permease [Acetobacteraceae bacterium]
MTLLKRYLRDDRFSFLGWTLGVVAMVALVLETQPTLGASPGWQEYMSGLPSWIEAMAGGSFNPGSLDGWLSLEWFSWMTLLIGTAGVLGGAGVLARDLESKSVEFLLAQPVRRWRVVAERYLGVALELFGLTLASAAAVELGGRYWLNSPGSYAAYRIVAANHYLLCLFLAAVATLASVLCGEQRRAVMTGLGVLFGGYILDLVLRASGRPEWLRALGPFYYHDFGAVLRSGWVPWGHMGVLAAGTVAVLAAAAWVFERKDLKG